MKKSISYGFDHYGDINVLEERQLEIGLTDKKDVLIRTEHISVNPAEISIRKGLFSASSSPKKFRVLGNEIQGEVIEVNNEDSSLAIGDKVLALLPNGGDSEFVATHHTKVFKLPQNMPLEVAAGFPMIVTTAYWALSSHFYHLKKGDRLAIVGASGSVGSIILQLAHQKEITILAVGSSKNADYLTELGADYVLDYHNEEQVHSFENWADYVINASLFNSGESLAVSLVKEKGTYLGLNALPNLAERPDITAFYLEKTKDMRDEDILEKLLTIYETTNLVLRIGHILPFTLDSLKTAHHLIEEGKNNGKIILKR